MIREPDAIEKRSMEIIEAELKTPLDPSVKDIVKRVIHCTADFDYAENLLFSPNAAGRAHEALLAGCDIVTDTQMARAGINKAAAAKLGCSLYCFMSDPDVAEEAKRRGCTRASAAVEKAASLGRPFIFAAGNAPTALLTLSEYIAAGKLMPELVIGVPVGFVNILEAKDAIMRSGAEYIVSRGRKGGSNVAAAIVNALMYRITR